MESAVTSGTGEMGYPQLQATVSTGHSSLSMHCLQPHTKHAKAHTITAVFKQYCPTNILVWLSLLN